jgi:hypothetical protein
LIGRTIPHFYQINPAPSLIAVPRRITDINTNAESSHPANFVYMNNVLYFTAHNSNNVEHLWAYSLQQSQPLRCLTAALKYPSPRDVTAFNQILYFTALHESNGKTLNLHFLFVHVFRSCVLCAVLVVLIGLLPRNVIADCINPIALWKLEESGVNPEYQDEINPGSNAGVCRQENGISLCPQSEQARYGNGQRFYADGQHTGIDISSSTIFDWQAKDSFSISYWMKRNNSPREHNEVIIGRDSQDPKNYLHWWIGIQESGIAMVGLIDRDREPRRSIRHLRDDKLLTNDRWHFIVFVRNASTSESLLYVDGVLEDKARFIYDAIDAFSADSTPVNIGWLDLSPFFYYQGVIDEIALYDKALSQWFIHDRYHADKRYSSDQPDHCD